MYPILKLSEDKKSVVVKLIAPGFYSQKFPLQESGSSLDKKNDTARS